MNRLRYWILFGVAATCLIWSAAYVAALDGDSPGDKEKIQSGDGRRTPNPPTARDLVFLGETRPVLMRLHVQVEGKPVQAAWDDFMKSLFDYLDVNGDGVLSKEEAERAPAASQISGRGLGALAGGFGRGAVAPPAPSFDKLDADKDGKVSRAELADYYRKNGLAPFQVQTSAGTGFGGGALAFLGGKPEPSVQAVADGIFNLLDTNKDGKLSKAELTAAPDVLLRLDEDDDDVVTPRELVPDTKVDFLGMAMMGGFGKKGKSANDKGPILLLDKAGEAPANLVKRLQETYGPKAKTDDPIKLSRKDLGLDEATFAALDTDGDGLLDSDELAAFVKRTPDLEMIVRLGTTEEGDARVQLVKAKNGAHALADKLRASGDLATLDLGATRLDIRGTEDSDRIGLEELVRQQYLAQFRQADANNDGVLDDKEIQSSRLLKGIAKAIDREGKGTINEKQLTAYLDYLRDMQARSRAGCVTLVLSDQSRGLFDLLDANRDGRLGVREMRGAVKLLDQFDKEGKGFLTKGDLPRTHELAVQRGPATSDGALGGFAALYLGGGNYDTAPQSTAGPLWFRKMDKNRDGDVSRREWLFSDALFREIDTDGDGLISAREAEAYEAKRRKGK